LGRRLVYDIETNGFLDVLDRVHCLAIRDIDTQEIHSYADRRQTDKYPDITEGLEVLSKADLLVAHNGIGFDDQALRKVYPTYTTRAQHYDTLVLSRAVFTNLADGDFKRFRKGKFPAHLLKKNHSLEAWGYRLGDPKDPFKGPWDTWTQEMHDYCIQDTSPCYGLYNVLQERKVPEMVVETELELAWYLQNQEKNGFPFNEQKAQALYAELLSRRVELEQPLRERFKWWYVGGKVKTPKKTLHYKTKPHIYAGSPYTPIKRVEFSPSSRQHIARVFQKEYGWVPQEFTDKGEIKVDDAVIGALPYPEAKPVCEYLLVDKRIGALAEGEKAWLKLVTNDGKIHGYVNQSGTPTHRASHSNPNMTQVAKVCTVKGCANETCVNPEAGHSAYGFKSRDLFYAPEGWKLVGVDVSGLELRVLAHYMAKFDGGAYMKIVLEGDVHTANWNAGKPYLTTRDMAKTFIYAFIYGAGDWKLGHTCRPLASEDEKVQIGRKLRANFLRNLPALKQVVELIDLRLKEKKPFVLPSGHLVYPKSKHSALNYLIQSTGAVVCKRWLFHLSRELKRDGWAPGWSGHYATNVWAHDEIQAAVRDVDNRPSLFGNLAVSLIPRVQGDLNLRVPLTGEMKIGQTWADTH
jgi:DNA polymerase I-like protein with 3'-5' exonuclease and polymerase domains